MYEPETRRAFFTMTGAGLLLAACRNAGSETAPAPTGSAGSDKPKAESTGGSQSEKKKDKDEGEDVSATEDLMREHGVIRRVLVVYRESAMRLLAKPKDVPPTALAQAAKLIRTFAEDYHEKQLEEMHIFPAVKRAGGPAASEVDLLILQHQRGREITEYVLAATRATIGATSAVPVARALEAFARMYEEHAAREDTIVFPAWKKALSPKQLDEMGELFEQIEHKTFGKDGFDDAVEQAEAIERAIGFDPSALTAPPPPR